MEEENIKHNSVKAPNCEPVGPVASTTRHTTMSTEYAKHSSDKPIREDFPSVNSTEFVLFLIGKVIYVITEISYVLFLLVLIAYRLLTVSLTATSNWLLKIIENLDGKGKGRESDVNRGKTDNFLESSFSGNDKETGQSNSKVRRIKETNNTNQHSDYKEDHSFDICPINSFETANSVGSAYTIDNCFNNYGEGEQDYSYSKVNSSTSKDSHNNSASGLQDFSHAEICASKTEGAFNNESSRPQIYKGASIGNSNEHNVAIRRAYNNGKNATQNYEGHRFTTPKS